MLRKSKIDATPILPPKWVTTAFGFVVGVISGLLGAGGGFLSVPYLARANIPMPHAVATSAALGFFIAISNSVGYIWSGYAETKGRSEERRVGKGRRTGGEQDREKTEDKGRVCSGH